jgi:DNA-binding PadR family transcriptional regulator
MHHRSDCHFSRHHGSRGLGRFGRGFMDGDGLGGRAFGMGRKLASGDLQLLILALLADKPRHGYEIIKDLDERSNGFYVPSPGMIYPALTYLDEIGYATIETDGTRKRYHITDAGRQHLEENRASADALFAQVGRVGEHMDRVRRATRVADPQDEASVLHGGRGSKELQRARRDLKAALAEKSESPRDEQERIIGILARAAAEIRGR